jgi:hypothetical protein
MKTHKSGVHAFLNSALDGGQSLAPHSFHFTPMERTAINHWIGSWMGHRANLNMVEKKNIPASAGNQTLVI